MSVAVESLNPPHSAPGAQWFLADVHIHTPASHDFNWNGLDRKTFDPPLYVNHIIDTGLQLVAVTDHSTGIWIDEMKKAARHVAKQRKVSLVVLPGVEISIGGVHLTFLLPESKTQDHVEYLLSQLKISPDDRGRPDTVCTVGLIDAIKIGHESGALVVGAHCMSNSGIIGGIDGQSRQLALKALDALEIKPNQNAVEVRQRAVQCGWGRGPIFVGSDSHTPYSLSSATMWVKSGSPSFLGLKQTTYEPDLRVTYSSPQHPTHPRIVKVETKDGLYSGEPFTFSPHLNVLIGGRGAGKSAALDLVRFAFGLTTRRSENADEFVDRICAFVGQGGTVYVDVVDNVGRTLRIARRCEFELKSRGKVKILVAEPTVSELIDNRFIQLDATPQERFPIEFYGQNEVLELTRKADDQLRLIDEHVDFGDLRDREVTLCGKIGENAKGLVFLENQCDNLRQKVKTKDELIKRANYLRAQLGSPIFESRALWEKEKEFLGRLLSDIISIGKGIAAIQDSVSPDGRPLDPKTPNPAVIERVISIVGTLNKLLGESKVKSVEAQKVAYTELMTVHLEWDAMHIKAEESFQERLRELGVSNLRELHDELMDKERDIEEIEQVDEPLLAQKERERATHWAERRELLHDLLSVREGIHSARSNQVVGLTQKLNGSVRIELDEKGDRGAYLERMKSMFAGSGINNAEAQLTSVVDKLLPHAFVEMAVNRDVVGLATATNVTTNTANRLVSHPRVDDLLELETMDTPDCPRILLKRDGDAEWQALDQLSYGERCSAILAIALLDKGRVLVIDQPEDELDHQFITDDIVEAVRTIKETRQIIMATHNPNIPVLGDAELVFKVAKQPGFPKCRIAVSGALEEPSVLKHVLALEGGKEAFERRRQKYAISSSSRQY